jgi:hypothetical protein
MAGRVCKLYANSAANFSEQDTSCKPINFYHWSIILQVWLVIVKKKKLLTLSSQLVLSLTGTIVLIFYCKIRGAPTKLINQPSPLFRYRSLNFVKIFAICLVTHAVPLNWDVLITVKNRDVFQMFYFEGGWALRAKKYIWANNYNWSKTEMLNFEIFDNLLWYFWHTSKIIQSQLHFNKIVNAKYIR